MKRLLLLQLILLIASMVTSNQGPPGVPFNVYGYVLDETGAPVADAYVAVNSTIDQGTTRTDSLGRYVATISITGSGDQLKVVAQAGGASGTSHSIAPKGSPNLMINVTITVGGLETSSTTETAPSTTAQPTSWSFFLPVALIVGLAALILAARSILSRRRVTSRPRSIEK